MNLRLDPEVEYVRNEHLNIKQGFVNKQSSLGIILLYSFSQCFLGTSTAVVIWVWYS